MDAVIYSRVSRVSSTGRRRQSNDRQINELKELPDFNIKKIFKESISGYTKGVHERPQLQKALNYIKENKIEYLLIHEISRLGRRTSEVLTKFRISGSRQS